MDGGSIRCWNPAGIADSSSVIASRMSCRSSTACYRMVVALSLSISSLGLASARDVKSGKDATASASSEKSPETIQDMQRSS